MNERRATRLRIAARLAVGGFAVAAVVASAALASGDASCGQEVLGPHLALSCRDLVRTLSIRVGAVAGMATIVMSLFVAGLRTMARKDEEDRRARRLEAFREGLDG